MLNSELLAKALAEMGKLDNTNLQSDYTNNPELNYIESVMVTHGEAFIKSAIRNLEKSNKVNTGTLIKDISAGSVELINGVYTMSIGYPKKSKGAKYYDFVNKGVNGTQVDRGSDYNFKNYPPGKKMISAIMGWLNSNKRKSIKEDQTRGLSKLQRKRKKISKMISDADSKKSLAKAIAISIKKKGLPKTGFFDRAKDYAFGDTFKASIAKAAGKEITIRIRNEYNGK